MICYEKDGVQMIVNESMARVMESCGYKRAVEKAAPSPMQISGLGMNLGNAGAGDTKEGRRQYQKSEITRMSTADLRELAKSLGLDVAEGSTGKALKDEIVTKLGL